MHSYYNICLWQPTVKSNRGQSTHTSLIQGSHFSYICTEVPHFLGSSFTPWFCFVFNHTNTFLYVCVCSHLFSLLIHASTLLAVSLFGCFIHNVLSSDWYMCCAHAVISSQICVHHAELTQSGLYSILLSQLIGSTCAMSSL